MWRFHEFVALTCDLSYSMPLGLLGSGPYFFKVYRGAGLERALKGSDCILLLAPLEPDAFLDSVVHELEARLDPVEALFFDERLGSWYSCSPVYVGGSWEYSLYECDRLNPLARAVFQAYNRGYGCLVELLIIYTKAKAGVLEPDPGVVSYLTHCMERSGMGGGLVDRVRGLLSSL